MTLYLTQNELAERWKISSRTLERWRWRKLGPPYCRLGGSVRYRLADVEAYETAQLIGTSASRPRVVGR
jgi:hypothetical protein